MADVNINNGRDTLKEIGQEIIDLYIDDDRIRSLISNLYELALTAMTTNKYGDTVPDNSARISATNAILDRRLGKPKQRIDATTNGKDFIPPKFVFEVMQDGNRGDSENTDNSETE